MKPAPPALTSCAQPSDATWAMFAGLTWCRRVAWMHFRAVACSSIVEHPPARWGPMNPGAARRLSGGRPRAEVLVLGDELAGDEAHPLRVVDQRQPGPWGVEWPGNDLATEFAHLRRCGATSLTAKVTLQRAGRSASAAPIRLSARNHVDESRGSPHLRHLLAEARRVLLQVLAVAGQRPHHRRGSSASATRTRP